MPIQTEQTDLESLRRLEPQEISAVFDRYYPEVFRFVHYRLTDEPAAEDIASEVFVRLLESLKTGRGPHTNLKAWLLQTAFHLTTDYLRKKYRQTDAPLAETLADGSPNPALHYEDKEHQHRLKSAIATLTEDQQHVLALRFSQSYSLEETATLMQKNVNAIKQLQFRALAALNRALGDRL